MFIYLFGFSTILYYLYINKVLILSYVLDKYLDYKYKNKRIPYDPIPEYGLLKTPENAETFGSSDWRLGTQIIKPMYNDLNIDVEYIYDGKTYIYVISEETKFPIYTEEDIDSAPDLEFENIYICDIITGEKITIPNIKEILKPYAGPKDNFYIDVRPLSSKYIKSKELLKYYDNNHKLIFETLFGEVYQFTLTETPGISENDIESGTL